MISSVRIVGLLLELCSAIRRDDTVGSARPANAFALRVSQPFCIAESFRSFTSKGDVLFPSAGFDDIVEHESPQLRSLGRGGRGLDLHFHQIQVLFHVLEATHAGDHIADLEERYHLVEP